MVAWWDKATRAVWCERCFAHHCAQEDEAPPSLSTVVDLVPAYAGDAASSAGGSARAEYEGRSERHRKKVTDKWGDGFVGKVALAVSEEPVSTQSWGKGASGEERLAVHLQRDLGDRVVMLHDRLKPRSKANIDHIIVAASGIWIVDAKNYKGKVECRDVGNWRKVDRRLYVAGRDRSKIIAGMDWQVETVRSALASAGVTDVPIHPVICFTNAEWPLVCKGFTFGDVRVSWARLLVKQVDAATHVLEPERLGEIAGILHNALRKAVAD